MRDRAERSLARTCFCLRPLRSQVLERGEKIELHVDKAESLQQHAFTFRKQATSIRRMMCCKNVKLTVAIILVATLILLVILLAACNPDFKRCGAK